MAGAAGAGTAFNEVTNNMLLHNNQLDAIKRLAKGNKDKEQKLFAAACYLMKCSAEFVSGTKNYATFAAVEQQGAQYTAELSQLQNYSYTEQKPSASGYPAVGNTVTYKNLFSYTKEDQANDGMEFARNYRINQLQQRGMSYAAAMYVIDGADFGLLMLGMEGGK